MPWVPSPDGGPDVWEVPKEARHYKRLIVLCDGTGKSSDHGIAAPPTNVTRIARALKPSAVVPADPENGTAEWEIQQIVLYQTGVGTDGVTSVGDGLAATFGWGLDIHVLEAYNFIANNWELGDEIFIFGFSRGAFTARALASVICNVGLLTKDRLQFLPAIYENYKKRRSSDPSDPFNKWFKEHASQFKFQKEVLIRILGVFDTVGSLGLPETGISRVLSKIPGVSSLVSSWNDGYGYHDTSFPIPQAKEDYKGFIWKAYQALALDENRISFGPTLMFKQPLEPGQEVPDEGTMLQQVWFPGVHTDVGGGYERQYRDLSDISLAWMMDLCKSDLEFHDIREELKEPSWKYVEDAKTAATHKHPEPNHDWATSKQHDEYHTAKFIAGGAEARKPGQYKLDNKTGTQLYQTNEEIHASVRYRMMKNPDYRPEALKGFKLDKDEAGWFWRKTINAGWGKKEEIKLREWAVWGPTNEDDDDVQASLLTPQAVNDLEDDAKSRKIAMV